MTVSVINFDNPEVMQVPQAGGQNLFFCSGVAVVNFAGTSNDFQRDELVFLVPSEAAGVVTVVPATVQNTDPADTVGWGIDNADSIVVGNNIQVTAGIAVRGNGASVLRVAYHAVILG